MLHTWFVRLNCSVLHKCNHIGTWKLQRGTFWSDMAGCPSWWNRWGWPLGIWWNTAVCDVETYHGLDGGSSISWLKLLNAWRNHSRHSPVARWSDKNRWMAHTDWYWQGRMYRIVMPNKWVFTARRMLQPMQSFPVRCALWNGSIMNKQLLYSFSDLSSVHDTKDLMILVRLMEVNNLLSNLLKITNTLENENWYGCMFRWRLTLATICSAVYAWGGNGRMPEPG